MSKHEASINCPDCGGENDPASSFCGLCGAPMERGPAEPTGSAATEDLGNTPKPGEETAGTRIGGLVLGDEIDRGGMGVIYEAFDEHLDRRVAVKVISPELAGDIRFRKRFIAETKAVASLNNPFILPVYQAGEEDGTLFLITKLVNGGDLASALRERGTLSPEETAVVVSEIADALGAAHDKGMIHRDVKPANILVDDESGEAHYYLTDFGLTKYGMETTGITNTGEVLGTVDYMAPEQIEGGAIDERVDIYALGCLAAELLNGRPPFRRDSKQATLIAHLNDEPEIPGGAQLGRSGGLRAILLKALAKNPDDRYQTAEEFSQAFSSAIGQGVLSSDAATQMMDPATLPPAKKSRTGILVAGLAALVLLAGGGGYVLAGGAPFGVEQSSPPITGTTPKPEGTTGTTNGDTGTGSGTNIGTTTPPEGTTGTINGDTDTGSGIGAGEGEQESSASSRQELRAAHFNNGGEGYPIQGIFFYNGSSVPWATTCYIDPFDEVTGDIYKRISGEWIPINYSMIDADWPETDAFKDGAMPGQAFNAFRQKIRECADDLDTPFADS